MKLSDVLRVPEAAQELGIPSRAVYRAIRRAEAAGKTVTTDFYGKNVVLRSALPVLKDYYYPVGSVNRRAMAGVWAKRRKRVRR